MATKKKSKPKKASIRMTLFDVILSYPDLHNPKPFKGNTYYSTDILLDADHSQLGELRKAIKKVKVQAWGDDPSEYPKGAKKKFVQDGSEREDQKGYKDRFYVKASTNASFGPVAVVDLKGKTFNPQSVKGGMFANVAINISQWKNDDDEGMNIYLEGVQIDTKKESLQFGGGRSIKQMFGMEDESDESDDEDNESDDSDDEEEDQPRGKKKKKPARDEDESDDEEEEEDNEDEDESEEDEEEDESPKRNTKKKKPSRSSEDDEDEEDSDEEEDEEPVRKKKKKPARDEDEEE